MGALFPFGAINVSDGVARLLGETRADVATYFRRHLTGDWGVLEAEERALNDRAVNTGGRIHSAYDLPGGQRICIITEADRSVTTIFLPEEY